MSFILDALKRSEQERRRQQAPTLLELPSGRPRRALPWWLMVVVGLLVVNALFLLGLWWRHAAPEHAAVPAPQSQVAPAPVLKPRSTGPIRSLEEEAAMDVTAADESADAIDMPPASTPLFPQAHLNEASAPLVRSLPTNNDDAASTQQPAVNASSTASTPEPASKRVSVSGVPTLESLGGHGVLGLPALRLDLHVYASKPSERMVFINGKRYRENETTQEGTLVESITNDGVILSLRGQRFLLVR